MKKKGKENAGAARAAKVDKSNLVVYIVVILFVVGALTGVVLSGMKKRGPKVIDSDPGFEFNATDNLDMKEILKHKVPVMLNFGTDGDQASEAMAPIIYELNQQLMGKAMIKYVDVMKNKKVSEEFPIATIPTQIFINADGSPYRPENVKDSNLIVYGDEKTGTHFLTAHEGAMTKEKILEILADMGVDVSGVDLSSGQ